MLDALAENSMLQVPWDDRLDHRQSLADDDYVAISGYDVMAYLLSQPGVDPHAIDACVRSWDDLGPDNFMADGGTYRRRRHATMHGAASGASLVLKPHQPHFQAVDYNRLNGGIDRHYEPIRHDVMEHPVMTALLRFAASTFGALAPFNAWHVELHQFRIAAVVGGGQPTPEGLHRDGVNYVMMTLIARRNVSGGVTSVHAMADTKLAEFTLEHGFDTALVNDERVRHAVTPVYAIAEERPSYRDVLVVTFKRHPRAPILAVA